MTILTPSFVVGMLAGAFLMALGNWVGAIADRIRGLRHATTARSTDDRDGHASMPRRAKRVPSAPPRRPMANVRPKRTARQPVRERDDVRDWLVQMGYPEEIAADVSDKVAGIVPATAPLDARIREAMHHLPQEN
jgi:hypothetical protein